MFRNSHNSKSLSTKADKPVPRQHIVILALVLALSFGSAVQTPPLAQAAGAEKRFFIEAKKDRGTATICVGDLVSIHVRVVRAQVRSGVPFNVETIPGVRVLGAADFPNIGQVTPRESRTMWNSDVPGSANFVFHAENPGTTTISFEGRVNQAWGGSVLETLINPSRWESVFDTVDVTVQDCSYKVTTYSKWQVPGPANIKIKAWVTDAGLTNDGTGHYTGTGSVTWQLTSGQVGDCGAQSATTTSEVILNGERVDDQLIVDIDFLAANISLPVYCVGSDGGIASGVTPAQMIPDPVTLTVSSGGGGKRQDHLLKWPEPETGSVVVLVTRVVQQ